MYDQRAGFSIDLTKPQEPCIISNAPSNRVPFAQRPKPKGTHLGPEQAQANLIARRKAIKAERAANEINSHIKPATGLAPFSLKGCDPDHGLIDHQLNLLRRQRQVESDKAAMEQWRRQKRQGKVSGRTTIFGPKATKVQKTIYDKCPKFSKNDKEAPYKRMAWLANPEGAVAFDNSMNKSIVGPRFKPKKL